jgi:hypothetical protein
MRSAYLSLGVSGTDEAGRIYTLLSDGGQIFMPMEETFVPSALRCSGTSSAPPGWFSTGARGRKSGVG